MDTNYYICFLVVRVLSVEKALTEKFSESIPTAIRQNHEVCARGGRKQSARGRFVNDLASIRRLS